MLLAAFSGFTDMDFVKGAYERASFVEDEKEVQRIEEIWDPENVFKWQHVENKDIAALSRELKEMGL